MADCSDQTISTEDVFNRILQRYPEIGTEQAFQQQQQICIDLTVRHQTNAEHLDPQNTQIYRQDLQQHAQIYRAHDIQKYTGYQEEQPLHQPKTPTHVRDICNKAYKSKRDLANHHIVHTGQKAHICEVCNKGFFNKISLHKHYSIHAEQKPHKCKDCQKGFISKTALHRHYMIHTGEKPYKCDMCQKSFIEKSALHKHYFTHNEEKPYKCDVCHKSFIRKDQLQRHTFIHTGEKPHVCVVCKKGFSNIKSLTNHKRIHTGERLHCDVCQQEFVWEHSLKKHYLTHNREHSANYAQTKLTYNKTTFTDSRGSHGSGLIPTEQQVCFENTQRLPSFNQTFSHVFNQTLNNDPQGLYPLWELDHQGSTDLGQEAQQQIGQQNSLQIGHETVAFIGQQPDISVDQQDMTGNFCPRMAPIAKDQNLPPDMP